MAANRASDGPNGNLRPREVAPARFRQGRLRSRSNGSPVLGSTRRGSPTNARAHPIRKWLMFPYRWTSQHVKASETRAARRAVCCAALRCSRNRRCARVQRQTRVSNLSRSLVVENRDRQTRTASSRIFFVFIWRLSVRFMVDYRLVASKLSTIVLGGTAAPLHLLGCGGRSFFGDRHKATLWNRTVMWLLVFTALEPLR